MKYLLLALLILSSVGTAFAEDVFREPETSTLDTINFYNYPYWIAVNSTGAVYVQNVNTVATNYAEINLSGGNASNLTYLSGSNLFRAYLTSTVEENVPFVITFKNSSGAVIASVTDTLRFRVPFEVEIKFYKNHNTSSTDTEAYDNEFQYGVLHLDSSGSGYSYELKSSNSLGWLNSIGRIFPYYRDIGSSTEQIRNTQEIYVFARLIDGVATFQVYENATYTLHTVNAEIFGGLSSMYEFGRPIGNGDTAFTSTIAGDINIATESAASYSVFISAWEVYKWNLTKNILKIVGALMIWGFLVVGLSFFITGWLPADTRPQAFATVAGVIALTTSPILVVAVRVLW